ncbi:uncharacterized protein [Ptychodera flava]|uniref:uncharacterized protein isoform X2 n=1 Tax=Ptychodera flava TaxID=63121 RepID=UPI00396A3FA7
MGMNMHPTNPCLMVCNKVQQRYSFTPKQKEVLMKHFNMHGMTGQSQAYHEKIMACAREADVDFDIVRNWIGNVRRKKRIEASRYSGSNGLYIMDGTASGSEHKIPRLEGPHYGFSRQPSIPTTLARQPTSIMHPIASMSLQPQPFSMQSAIAAEMQASQAPVGSGDQSSAGATVSSGAGKPQPLKITKVEPMGGQQSSCALSGQLPVQPGATTSTAAAVLTAPPLPSEREGITLHERQMKEIEIRRTMGSIQQSMQYLERLGCETIVVSHYEGKTFVSGTEKGVNYFAEMQEVKPISEHIRPPGVDSAVFSPSGTDSSNSAPDDASSQEHKTEKGGNVGQGSEEAQNGKVTDKSGRGDKPEEDKDNEQNDNEDEDDDDDDDDYDDGIGKRDTNIRSGQEVYIVDKNHFVIGIGNILPSPHQKIMLKNAPPPEDYFD